MRVEGFHGTDGKSAASILESGFEISRNVWDWLGDGVYFFQDAPVRAWEWARSRYGTEAAVVGSIIRLESCMDLLDIGWSRVLGDSYDSFLRMLKEAGLPLPVQTRGAHRLDRTVVNYVVGVLREQGVEIRAVRGAFSEGEPVFPTSALFDRAHVQVAVRDLSLIERSWLA